MCLITVLPILRPGPEPRPVRRRRERMNRLTDLRGVVDVVIGVDTHVHTDSAAVVDAATGGVLDEITVEATGEGWCRLKPGPWPPVPSIAQARNIAWLFANSTSSAPRSSFQVFG